MKHPGTFAKATRHGPADRSAARAKQERTNQARRPARAGRLLLIVGGVMFTVSAVGMAVALIQQTRGARQQGGFATTRLRPLPPAQWGFGKGLVRYVTLPVLEHDGDSLRIVDRSARHPQADQLVRRLPGGDVHFFRNGRLFAISRGRGAAAPMGTHALAVPPQPGQSEPIHKTLIMNEGGHTTFIAVNMARSRSMDVLFSSRRMGFLEVESCPGVRLTVDDK